MSNPLQYAVKGKKAKIKNYFERRQHYEINKRVQHCGFLHRRSRPDYLHCCSNFQRCGVFQSKKTRNIIPAHLAHWWGGRAGPICLGNPFLLQGDEIRGKINYSCSEGKRKMFSLFYGAAAGHCLAIKTAAGYPNKAFMRPVQTGAKFCTKTKNRSQTVAKGAKSYYNITWNFNLGGKSDERNRI